MAPSDNVDPGETPPGEAPSPEASPAPTGEPQAPQFTPEQLADAMTQASQSGNQEILEALQGMQQLIQQQAQANQPDPTVEPNELAERLLTDPKATLNQEINEWGKQNLAPMLSRELEVVREERIEAQGAKVNAKFGDGWFEENIAPRLTGEKGNLSAYPINQQADPAVIRGAIAAILGNMELDPEEGPKMDEAKAKAAKARHEREVASPPNMMGPGRSYPNRGTVLTPEMKEAMSKFKDVGYSVSEADLKGAMTRDNTLEAWVEAHKQ